MIFFHKFYCVLLFDWWAYVWPFWYLIDDNIDEEEIKGSGIPEEILSLKSLEELVLSHQALRYVPSQISNLRKLKKFDVSSNPLLISLPASLGSLPVQGNISTVHDKLCWVVFL